MKIQGFFNLSLSTYRIIQPKTSQEQDAIFNTNQNYAVALVNEKAVTKDWGMGGDKSRAMNAVTMAVTGALGGQTDLQVVANSLAPYAANVIGKELGHGEDKNKAAQLAAHAILGATLAYVNGGNPAAGGSAAVASEAAADYLTNRYKDKKEYQDVNGEFQANLIITENSGHYGRNWNNETAQKMIQLLQKTGEKIDYTPWGGKK